MKYTLLTAAAVLAMGVAPALAEDGHVPQSTLSSIGLGGMHMMTEAEGTTVRGAASFASVSGSSLVFGQVVSGQSFVVGSSVDKYSAGGAHLFPLPSIAAAGNQSNAAGSLGFFGPGFIVSAGGYGAAFAF